jgi:hypothetical protein
MNLVWYNTKDNTPYNMIPLGDMKDGWLYAGEGRNFSIGVWNAEEKVMEGVRYKWHSRFIDGEGHYGDGRGCFIPVAALEDVGPMWCGMEESGKMGFLDGKADRLERLSEKLDQENPQRLRRVWNEG